MRPVVFSHSLTRGTPAAWQRSVNGSQNEGPVNAASTSGSSSSIASWCSGSCVRMLPHQSLKRVAQVPLAQVQLGVGEAGANSVREPVVVVAHDARWGAGQRAQKRLPVGL